ncbi:MAG: alpha/beta hydrolase [Aggregatilineales bacterium]
MTAQSSPMRWVLGYKERSEGAIPNTYTATYGLLDLMNKGYLYAEDVKQMLDDSGLEDFFWQITWPEDFDIPDEYLVNRIANVQGYVVFVHGWTGNHKIWEELPGRVTMANRQLVSISIDHNGFGKSVLTDVTPSLEACNPPAAMQTLRRWAELVKLRRQPGERSPKVLNFVGHSMGGATLFYLNPMFWNYGEVTRYALAPALLLEDSLHRAFYTTLGVGIGILQRLPALEIFERFLKPTILKNLAAGATNEVKEIHRKQYDETPRGITGATFMAMGRLANYEIARDWDLFRVMLGHRDPLVGLTDMMDLLGKLELPAGNTRVVPGTHYMFSVGSETPRNAYQHAQNRDLVVQDILALHIKAYQLQRDGRRIG